jgi:hypothetical protein
MTDAVDQHVRRSATRRCTLVATVVAALLVTVSCSSSGDGSRGASSDTSRSPQATGIPARYEDGIAEGKQRYPDVGSTGQGDMSWECPLTDAVQVDGRSMDEVLMTTFTRLADGIYEVSCEFFPPTPVDLRFAKAEDEAAYAELVEDTGAFEQVGNEQVEEELTIGERTFITVTWTFPTNPKAGTRYVACYLDEVRRGRVCLDVANSDERSEDYGARQAAEELAAILSA